MNATPLRDAVEALEYLIHEFERTGRIDEINMTHAVEAASTGRAALDDDPDHGWARPAREPLFHTPN